MDNVMSRGRLKYTIGLPRSGKSCYCNRWADYMEDIDEDDVAGDDQLPTRVIVCGDDIRIALHGDRFNVDAEPMVWAIHTYMVKAHLLRGCDVIIDGTNTTEDSLRRVLDLDPDAEYVLIDTPLEECQKRAIACNHADLVEGGVIHRQHTQLELMKAEGLDTVVARVRDRVRRRRNML